ncbi:MAG: hypothetical protein KatS3mg025_1755 [Bacteroidia bacterium]|nr:MAG: hypothetical protein KatS3mg025_1755 [Bacteroidia bacterium]
MPILSDIYRTSNTKYLEWITQVFPPHRVDTVFIQIEWVIFVAYILILSIFANRKIYNLDQNTRKILNIAWYSRVVSSLLIYVLFKYYYNGGDTINYMNDAKSFLICLIYNPINTTKYILHSIYNQDFYSYFIENPSFYSYWLGIQLRLNYLYDPISEFVSILYIPFLVIALGSIPASILVFDMLFFSISIQFLHLIRKIYPNSTTTSVFILFFMPSLLSWTSTPFKEAFSLVFIMHTLLILFHSKKNILYRLSSAILALYLCYSIKPYVALSFLPFLLLFAISKNPKTNTLISKFRPLYYLMIILFSIFSYLIVSILASKNKKYSIENIPYQVYLIYTDLKYNESYYSETGGSRYDIGEIEPTFSGMISKFPISFITGLFRPFFWEAHKPIILLASIETLLFSSLILYYVFSYGILSFLRKILSNNFSFYFILFSIIFIYITGLTSGNFGNLVRYRLPGTFFFYLIFFCTYEEIAREARNRRRRL